MKRGFLVILFIVGLLFVGCSSDNMTVKGGVSSASMFFKSATSGIDPASFSVKVYKAAFSTSEYCTNPTVFDFSTDAAYQDFSDIPTLAEGELADGVYKCIVIELLDLIKFTPATTSDNGYCVAGTEITMDVCQTGLTSTLLDGTTTTCTTGTEDTVALYISTVATDPPAGTEGSQGFTAPTEDAPYNASLLESALTVSGATIGTFYAQALGLVMEGSADRDSEGECEMDEPSWGFE